MDIGRGKAARHIQVVYATSAEAADASMLAKAALAHKLGIEVSLCGTHASDMACVPQGED